MSNYAVTVESVTKTYRLGEKIGKTIPTSNRSNEFHALKDVSFQIKPGEVVGVIGRNGAGKSTMLKILSRIARPTSGRVICRGRLASLLEVGTGFHPELTGRENIFLNGAILGMSRREIQAQFDEIVAFSEIEKFLDTPVKRYSSGMYVRLAFAVAAHLEPEILIVDEVLAVGDASFQKRCLEKMESVHQRGRTVIFVSHSMTAVTRLCPRAILLEQGQVVADGAAPEVVRRYLQGETGSTCSAVFDDLGAAPGDDIAKLRSVRVLSEGVMSETVDIRREVLVEMRYTVLKGGRLLVPNLHFYNDDGICAFITNDRSAEWRATPKSPGDYVSTVSIPGNFFSEGTYSVNAVVSTMDPLIIHFDEKEIVAFQVVDSLSGDSVRGDYAGAFPGIVRPLLPWQTIAS